MRLPQIACVLAATWKEEVTVASLCAQRYAEVGKQHGQDRG